jgi:hypothetical protein
MNVRNQQRQFGKPGHRTRGSRNAVEQLALRPRILIVCEGAKTEPNYFRSFRVCEGQANRIMPTLWPLSAPKDIGVRIIPSIVVEMNDENTLLVGVLCVNKLTLYFSLAAIAVHYYVRIFDRFGK